MIEKIKDLYINKKHSVKEIAGELNISFWNVYDMMRKNDIPRRDPSAANYIRYAACKPKFVINEKVSAQDNILKIAGIMLYWAEGSKGGDGIDFANSDPEMIRIFLRFLRNICGISESRLRVYLYAYEGQNLNDLKSFWSELTQIPISQFTKPYVRKGNANLSGRKMLKGLIHIRYHDKKLLHTVLSWIKYYISSFK